MTGNDRSAPPSDHGPGPSFGPPGDPGGTPIGRVTDHPLPGYQANDFVAPTGVPPLAPRPAPLSAVAGPTATATPPAARPRLAAWVAAVAVSALVGAGVGVGGYAYLAGVDPVASSPIRVTTGSAPQAAALDGTITAAAAGIAPSAVTIAVQGPQGSGVGSGVVLDTDGHIVTNEHVVGPAEGGGTVQVTFHDGRSASARVVGTAAQFDLAVIKVDGIADLTPATFARSSVVQVGQTVVAVGNPLGLSESVTAGIVSSTDRPVRSGDDADAVYLAVQTDAAINPGNSGGALVDLNAAVVGINSSIATTGQDSGNIGIGFAIPADVVTRVAAELVAGREASTAALGVQVGGRGSAMPVSGGVELQEVTPGGAAAAAGLEAGDRITRVGDFRVTTADGLIAATRFHAPGTELEVGYVRDGKPETVTVTLGTT